jgi:hypothetical protein
LPSSCSFIVDGLAFFVDVHTTCFGLHDYLQVYCRWSCVLLSMFTLHVSAYMAIFKFIADGLAFCCRCSHYMFRPTWPSSGLLQMVLRFVVDVHTTNTHTKIWKLTKTQKNEKLHSITTCNKGKKSSETNSFRNIFMTLFFYQQSQSLRFYKLICWLYM